jgi:hypothetical protein
LPQVELRAPPVEGEIVAVEVEVGVATEPSRESNVSDGGTFVNIEGLLHHRHVAGFVFDDSPDAHLTVPDRRGIGGTRRRCQRRDRYPYDGGDAHRRPQ